MPLNSSQCYYYCRDQFIVPGDEPLGGNISNLTKELISLMHEEQFKINKKKPNDSIVIRSTGRSGDCSVKEIQL